MVQLISSFIYVVVLYLFSDKTPAISSNSFSFSTPRKCQAKRKVSIQKCQSLLSEVRLFVLALRLRHQTASLVCHRFDIGMWYCLELVEVELVLRSDVDVSTLVFGAVAISRRREDYTN